MTFLVTENSDIGDDFCILGGFTLYGIINIQVCIYQKLNMMIKIGSCKDQQL